MTLARRFEPFDSITAEIRTRDPGMPGSYPASHSPLMSFPKKLFSQEREREKARVSCQ